MCRTVGLIDWLTDWLLLADWLTDWLIGWLIVQGLLPHVTHPVPIITETSPDAICRDDLESMEWPEVPEEDPGAEGDDLDPGYPRGNM